MTKHRPGKKEIGRYLKTAVFLAVLAAAGLVGWMYLTPMLTAGSVTLYDSYTAETGDIQTSLSFSASLDVKKSQTFTASEFTRVKELFVDSGDEVQKDDPLMLLSNGEFFTAGFDGVVNEIRVKVGDWLRPNFYAVQICDLVNLQVTMSVDEYDVKSLYVGQPCRVHVISLGIDFTTVIAHINRVSSSSGTLAYYTVTCDLTVPPEVLPGMRAMVSIPAEAVEGVTVLPVSALAFDETGNPYTLYKSETGAYEKKMVETGLSDGMRVEITRGVQAGDQVYAVSGWESIEAAISLTDIYRALAGETVVIHEPLPQRANRRMPGGDTGESAPPGDVTYSDPPGDMPLADKPQPDMNTTP